MQRKGTEFSVDSLLANLKTIKKMERFCKGKDNIELSKLL